MVEVFNMSNIITMRTLICENIAVTFRSDQEPQFILAFHSTDKLWAAQVGDAKEFQSNVLVGSELLQGRGKTPELAYQSLLKVTASLVSEAMERKPKKVTAS